MVGGLDLGWLQTVGRKWGWRGSYLRLRLPRRTLVSCRVLDAAKHQTAETQQGVLDGWVENEALLLACRQPWMNGENPRLS